MTTNPLQAQCACGQAAITVDRPPSHHGICHCTNCKRRTGSAFGVSAYFDREAVIEQRGEMRVYAFHHAEQKHDQQRHFCAHCGTTLFWFISTWPQKIGIAGGCFERGVLPEPRGSHHTSHKEAWVTVPGHWPVIDG